MRNISFSLTIPQFKDRSKWVTRRLGWTFLKPGQNLMACEKCQGIKPGEKIVRLGEIVVMSVRNELLEELILDQAYGRKEVIAEGFPDLTPEEFVQMFCAKMKCAPQQSVCRIAFCHAPEN